jgi:hypothetical protein
MKLFGNQTTNAKGETHRNPADTEFALINDGIIPGGIGAGTGTYLMAVASSDAPDIPSKIALASLALLPVAISRVDAVGGVLISDALRSKENFIKAIKQGKDNHDVAIYKARSYLLGAFGGAALLLHSCETNTAERTHLPEQPKAEVNETSTLPERSRLSSNHTNDNNIIVTVLTPEA